MTGRTDAAAQPPAAAGTWRGPVTLAPPEAFDDREARRWVDGLTWPHPAERVVVDEQRLVLC